MRLLVIVVQERQTERATRRLGRMVFVELAEGEISREHRERTCLPTLSRVRGNIRKGCAHKEAKITTARKVRVSCPTAIPCMP